MPVKFILKCCQRKSKTQNTAEPFIVHLYDWVLIISEDCHVRISNAVVQYCSEQEMRANVKSLEFMLLARLTRCVMFTLDYNASHMLLSHVRLKQKKRAKLHTKTFQNTHTVIHDNMSSKTYYVSLLF